MKLVVKITSTSSVWGMLLKQATPGREGRVPGLEVRDWVACMGVRHILTLQGPAFIHELGVS